MTRARFADLPAPMQAGILCTDSRFRRFVAVRLSLAPITSATITETAAAEFIRQQCGIQSRRELATDAAAHAKFQALRTEFDAWAGKIANPRQ